MLLTQNLCKITLYRSSHHIFLHLLYVPEQCQPWIFKGSFLKYVFITSNTKSVYYMN